MGSTEMLIPVLLNRFDDSMLCGGFPRWLSDKKKKIHLLMQKKQVRSLGQEDPLEKEMATHSGILA